MHNDGFFMDQDQQWIPLHHATLQTPLSQSMPNGSTTQPQPAHVVAEAKAPRSTSHNAADCSPDCTCECLNDCSYDCGVDCTCDYVHGDCG